MAVSKLFDSSHELTKVLLNFRSAFFQVGAFSFVINLLMLAPALYMMSVYDRIMTSRNEFTLLFMTLLLVALFLLMGFLEWVRARIFVRVGTKMDDLLHGRVFNAAFEANLKQTGANPAQAMGDLATIRQFLAGSGVLVFFDVPWLPIFVSIIFLIHPVLGLFSLFAAFVLFMLALLNEVYTKSALDEASVQFSRANAYANNNLRNAEVIAAMGFLPGIYSRWDALHGKFLSLQALASDRAAVIQSITKVCRIAFQSFILGLAAWLAIEGLISPGALIGAMVLMGRSLGPVEQVIGVWRQWSGVRESHQRLKGLLDVHPLPPESMPLPDPKGELTVEGAFLSPPGRDAVVLRGLSFRVNAGDVVGVIGPSGAGKSCLARMLVGVWRPKSGVVRLDGADMAHWDRALLGPHVGYLPQDVELFEGTVAENICRFGVMDNEHIVQAAMAAGVHDLILRLPQGYDTQIGVDGGALSGGQRQRLALARALYKSPKVLVLDEPNSSLDDAGEAALLQAIRHLKSLGTTVVLVSHRTNMLPVIDKLLVMRDGAMAGYGPRDQMLAQLQAPSAGVIRPAEPAKQQGGAA